MFILCCLFAFGVERGNVQLSAPIILYIKQKRKKKIYKCSNTSMCLVERSCLSYIHHNVTNVGVDSTKALLSTPSLHGGPLHPK